MSDFKYIVPPNEPKIIISPGDVGIAPTISENIPFSLRFNGTNQFLNRTPASAGNRKTWTWSGWVKRGGFGATTYMFNTGTDASNPHGYIYFIAGSLSYHDRRQGGDGVVLTTNVVFRDPSSWYHIVLAVDRTQATNTNRAKFYVNGSEVTSFSTATYPNQNEDSYFNSVVEHRIGGNVIYFFDGHLAEINFIDGQALTPSSFGQYSNRTNSWVPKRYLGTYGTNGFWLDFRNNSSTSSLGQDTAFVSGLKSENNSFTTNNLSTSGVTQNQTPDSPSNNFCTLNPLAKMSSVTLSNGNLEASSSSASVCVALGTHGANTGKWYFEMTLANNVAAPDIGWHQSEYTDAQLNPNGNVRGGGYVVCTDGNASFVQALNNGTSTQISPTVSAGTAWLTNDVIGCAIDMDNKRIWFSRNGTWYPASVGGAAGSPSAGTNPAITYTYSGQLLPRTSAYSTNYTPIINFGQRPFFSSAPSGFKSLCTANLPIPIIRKPNQYMDVVTYVGNGSTQTIGGLGFSPDLVWVKARNNAYSNYLYDSVRGVGTSKSLISDATAAEGAGSTNANLTSFDSNGFSLGTTSSTNGMNANAGTFVAWAWDAGSSTSSNNSGTITSNVRVNALAGFSIVSYTGTGANATVGHGLGVAPKMVIVKQRGTTVTDYGWRTYHEAVGNTRYLLLNATDIAATFGDWNNTSPTSTVFSVGSTSPQVTTANGAAYIAYCFAEVEGYSKFGSYAGNGSTDGPFIYCGFRPAFILLKQYVTAGGNSWSMWDFKRGDTNQIARPLYANVPNAEATSATDIIDILSNGFKIRGTNSGTINYSSAGVINHIFAAFAEVPFKYANAR